MIKKRITFLLIIAMSLNLTACQRTNETRYQASFLELFDTVTNIVGYAKDKEEFTKYSEMIYENLKEYHELYDIYHNYEGINNIKTINDNAGIKPVTVDQRIIDLLKFSIDAYEITNGKVNIAYGAVLSVWHDYRKEGIDNENNAKLPPIDLLREKAKHTNMKDVVINEEESSVYLKDPEMSLDVGAIAKGYATEMVMNDIKNHGFTNGMISVGGNVKTIGSKLKNHTKVPWNVGIQNPDLKSDKANLFILKLTNSSLVTSGVYERYYTVSGKQYHHIIDPDTLMPSDYFLSVSIACNNSAMADALSTSIFNMSYEDGVALIESLNDTEALWVLKDGTMKQSSGFHKLIQESLD